MASTDHARQRQTGTALAARPGGFLRRALFLDVILTGANGIGYVSLATVLDDVFGFSRSVQYPVGVFLIVFALFVLRTATRREIDRSAVTVIIALNGLWAVASVVVAWSGVLGATGLGTGWTVLQGLVVGGFAVLQYVGLRRA
ncbi:hypothetical protein [Streptomyces sp. NPDC003077]|uniref:hypothetical protein n=1 Tax=Streptomyces sp. NPDC003077 TaxID=3154443 RepID=UPI00339FB04B